MDDPSTPSLPLRPASEPPTQRDLLPDEFVPLSLVLLPKGVRVELTKPDVLMGRHSDSDIRLPLPDVSRRHCRFVFTRSGWQVVDLNSLNGIHVNGKRVTHATLRHNDRLRIGSFNFEVELPIRSRPTGPESDRTQHLPDSGEQRRAS